VILIPGYDLPLCFCHQCHLKGYYSLSSLFSFCINASVTHFTRGGFWRYLSRSRPSSARGVRVTVEAPGVGAQKSPSGCPEMNTFLATPASTITL